MNPHFKKLAETAGIDLTQQADKINAFAESIVKECAYAVDPGKQKNRIEEMYQWEIVNTILRRFGL
jgi:hypothetical protein